MISMMTVMMRIMKKKKSTMVERIPEILVTLIQIIQYCAKLIEHTKNVTIEKVKYLSPKSHIDVIHKNFTEKAHR